jgi:hypothetical protein
MAIKMVFHPSEENFYSEELISFTYVQGLAFSQKQKCADSLHHSILQLHPGSHILEVSTKSREKIGVAASAFNLRVGGNLLESVFQSSELVATSSKASSNLPKSSPESVPLRKRPTWERRKPGIM